MVYMFRDKINVGTKYNNIGTIYTFCCFQIPKTSFLRSVYSCIFLLLFFVQCEYLQQLYQSGKSFYLFCLVRLYQGGCSVWSYRLVLHGHSQFCGDWFLKLL